MIQFLIIVPCYNASLNLDTLITSVMTQSYTLWNMILVDDLSDDSTIEKIEEYSRKDARITGYRNTEKKFALRNIVENARKAQSDSSTVIAVIDGDDSLCNNDALEILAVSYSKGFDVCWTMHRWDTDGRNISRDMPSTVDPYSYPWASSHFRTFRASLLKKIHDDNFKNHLGEWFKRGYDQALLLPVLSRTTRRKFIPVVCYQYNINSVSMPVRNWTEHDQIATVNFVRARGFVSGR